MPGEAHFEILAKGRDLARGGEAADMRDMMADIVDLPRLYQRLRITRAASDRFMIPLLLSAPSPMRESSPPRSLSALYDAG